MKARQNRMATINAFSEYDNNLKHAITFRLQKQRHSDFYNQLCRMNDRIQAYKYMFMEKTPRYLMQKTQKLIHTKLRGTRTISSSILNQKKKQNQHKRARPS